MVTGVSDTIRPVIIDLSITRVVYAIYYAAPTG
ncbi:Uncharacterised protein [BD1-7 clade bacterium]|nr:Uncharacterised protein [BD1-7 clade bacterium]